jgi:hypothetical protein
VNCFLKYHIQSNGHLIYDLGRTELYEEYFLLGYGAVLKINRRFGGIYPLHLQVEEYAEEQETSAEAGGRELLLGVLFDPEDGGDIFLRNVS